MAPDKRCPRCRRSSVADTTSATTAFACLQAGRRSRALYYRVPLHCRRAAGALYVQGDHGGQGLLLLHYLPNFAWAGEIGAEMADKLDKIEDLQK